MAERAAAAADLPQDALIVKKVLESMGMTEYEPRVLQQLMDFMYRYTAEILQDAEAIAERAGAPRGEVSLPDVMLAVQSRAQHAFVQPPSQQLLTRMAAQHNRRPLPELRPDRHGLRLPPDADCLLAPNYQLAPRTPAGAAAAPPAQPQAQQQQQQQAGAPGVRRDHRIEIRAPRSLPAAAQQQQPAPEETAGAARAGDGGWVGPAAAAPPDSAGTGAEGGGVQDPVPAADAAGIVAGGASGQGKQDDIDLMFEDI